jgi:hypothetical protein
VRAMKRPNNAFITAQFDTATAARIVHCGYRTFSCVSWRRPLLSVAVRAAEGLPIMTGRAFGHGQAAHWPGRR